MKRHVIKSSLEMSFLQNNFIFRAQMLCEVNRLLYLRGRGWGRGCGHSRTIGQDLGMRTLSNRKTNAFLEFRRKVPCASLKEAPETSFAIRLGRSHF